jgi:hypothetical protein
MFGSPKGEEDPVEPSPDNPFVDVGVDGVRDRHADTSPFAQSCVVVSCCELPGVKFGLVVDCALVTVRDWATEKAINIRKHLLMHDLILLSSGRKNSRAAPRSHCNRRAKKGVVRGSQ